MVESSGMSLVWFAASQAFDRAIAIATVLREGARGLLKPVATLCTSGNSAEVVDLCRRKPCWVSERFRCRLSIGRSNRLITWMIGQRSEIAGKRYQGDEVC